MVVGVGIGTDLALNGVAAHAFCHIIYKALLFMSVGAVLYRTGRSRCTEIGGLARTMPWTAGFCVVGAASISAFPLFSGFVSKSMIMVAAADGGHTVVWLLLLFASAGVFHHAGIKVPFFAFWAHDAGLRPKEAPRNMLAAMGLFAAACIAIGTFGQWILYPHLPRGLPDYEPYTFSHVVQQTQLLVWSAMAFCTLKLTGLYPPELRSTNIDAEWVYRRGGRRFLRFVEGPLMRIFGRMSRFAHEELPAGLAHFARNPPGAMKLAFDRFQLGWAGFFRSRDSFDRARKRLAEDQARYASGQPGSAWPIGTIVLYTTLAFILFLVVYLLR
jgi:multicomponent Na+:H+ antiporter subunit D